MKLLVTGGLGFIGSNFILNTLKNDEKISITNIDAELLGSDHNNLLELKNSSNYHFVKGNITNRKLMEKLIESSDIVVNFAAESFVDRSILDANQFLVSNIRGTYTILEILRKQKKRFIQISTDEVYGSLENDSATEEYRFNPSNPYAATKASAELLVNSFVKTYDLDCVITRCTNNYGPRQFYEKLIPKSIFLANNNKKIPIYGKGKNSREWMHVQDHCEALLLIYAKGKIGENYNIGSGINHRNIEIAEKLLKIAKNKYLKINKKTKIKFVKDRPGHDIRYALNNKKILKKLGWKAKISLEIGLSQTFNWYLNNKNFFKSVSKKLYINRLGLKV